MALQISGSDAGEQATQVADLPALAQKLLQAGARTHYGELLDGLCDIEDPLRRRWASERVLADARSAAAAMEPRGRERLLRVVVGAVLGCLERDAREPKLLLGCGRALADLAECVERRPADASAHEARAGAADMIAAAVRLDATLTLEESQARLLAGAAAVADAREARLVPDAAVALEAGEARSLEPARGAPGLEELARGARAAAASALAPLDLRMSLCMIVRDEQDTLARCLASVAAAVEEIVILDTGSRDRTIEIARSFGARVIERPWTGSFADARNAAFDAARGDWLFYLDADEVLCEGEGERLRELTGRTWREAFYVTERSHTGELGEDTSVSHEAMRVFRNRPAYRFEGRVHEQIAHRLPTYLPDCVTHSGVRIEHFGYLASVRRERGKSQRNIELLLRQREEATPDSFLHFNLGSEYAAAGDAPAAVRELELAWSGVSERPPRESAEFAPALIVRLVAALRACSRPAEAIARAEQGLRRFAGFTDLVLEQALAHGELGEHERARELLRRCVELGDAPAGLPARAGAGSYLPRVALGESLMLAGELDEARELLQSCLREHPAFAGSLVPYARVLLAVGVTPAETVSECERHAGALPGRARLALGEVMLGAGASAVAEGQLREAGGSARARLALGEALLLQRRHGEAAESFASIEDADELAAQARRGELLARLAAGATDVALLERARTVGVSAGEVAVLEAWGRTLAGEPPSAPLSGEALSELLDALLRAHDFSAFEVLLGLLEHATLTARERREMLARMYLRRGFATSAADEWMAVCAEQPDAAALVGLARVAAAREMPREAGEFAAAALELDPGNAAAARLRERAAAAGEGARA